MKDYTNTSPSYNSKVPEFDTTDKGHADILNQAVEQLANNTFANHDAIDKVKNPTYDTSDTSTITSFPTFLSKFVTGLNIFKFFADLKAGLAYVLHTGNIVNNCVSTSTGNVLDAYQGKVLQDNITAEATARAAADTQLNSNMASKFDKSHLTGIIADCNDLFYDNNTICFATWDSSTLHSPAKEGVVGYGNGLLFGMTVGNGAYSMQLAMAVSSTSIYTRSFINGLWSAWTAK